MNWPDDFINKIICGDCLEVMKEMPDESIDMAITSPPYWGLRDYGIEQIFGGDKDCEHDFNITHRRKNDKSGGHGNAGYIGAEKAQDQARFGPPTKTCSKCGGWKGQLGLEPTPEMYIEHLTEIFNEVKRVLKKEGTLWLNIGDTYNAGRSGGWAGGKKGFSRPEIAPNQSGVNVKDLPPKCLTMIPERLAWSLIQNGWILRNKNIWHKRNSMPSSVTDRFSNTYEFVYMFNKNNKTILWRHKKTKEWVKDEPLGTKGIEGVDWEWQEVGANYSDCKTKINKDMAEQLNSPRARKHRETKLKKVSLWSGFTYYFDLDAVRESVNYPDRIYNSDTSKHKTSKLDNRCMGGLHDGRTEYNHPLGKNPGDVFEAGAETRTMGAIIGSGGGVKVPGGKGWTGHPPGGEHALRKDPRWCPPGGKNPGDFWDINTQPFPEAHFAVFPEKLCEKPIKAGCPEGGIVLDPFAGAGTALYVAKEMKRRFIGIDIKQEYCEITEKRLAQGVL